MLNEYQSFQKECITKCISKELSTLEASLRLSVTQRCVQQKINRFKINGDDSFIHGNKFKSHLSEENKNKIQKIKDIYYLKNSLGEPIYKNVNFKHFKDELYYSFGISASVGFVTKILKNLNHKSPEKHRVKKTRIYELRERKEHKGELLQGDATSFDWFLNGKTATIHGFIDDATGIPTGLYMTRNECLLGYLEAMRYTSQDYGLPISIYTDRAGVFFNNNLKTRLTQFGQMMERLGVEMIPAYTPQAKGRVERFWKTIKGRLPIEFLKRGIKTIEEANVFLRDEFPKLYKKWFAKKPKSEESFFVHCDMQEINQVLKVTLKRKSDTVGVFNFFGYRFCSELKDQEIFVHVSERDGIWVSRLKEKKNTRYEVKIVETDTTGSLPEVYKDLIERIFLANAKAKHHEIYLDIDFEGMERISKNRRIKNLA